MLKFIWIFFFGAFTFFALGQALEVSGVILDEETKQPIALVKIQETLSKKGAITDDKGRFVLSLDFTSQPSYNLILRALGYDNYEVVVNKTSANLTINLTPSSKAFNDVVVSGTRVSEKIFESPVSIQRLSAKDILASSSGNFYESLKNLRGVDISTSSAGFQAVNMRGFNSTAPVRIVQFVDGMDNQAPGLNFPVGNLVGANPLDLQSIEVITGPASALYGPNAFQGVVNMLSKDPFQFQGVSAELKTGSRNLMEGNFRFAHAFGKKQRLGLKITASYLQMKDWLANDAAANTYGDISANVNLSNIVAQFQYDPTLSQEDIDQWVALNNYIEFNPVVGQIGLNNKTITAPGYIEQDLAENNVQSFKSGLALCYKLKENSQLSYNGKFGVGSAIYQGANRYSINDIQFQQHKLEWSGKNHLIKAYTTLENAGNSYDAVFTGINISKASIGDNWVPAYLSSFFQNLSDLTNEYDDDASLNDVNQAMVLALDSANSTWYTPGTAAFDSLRASIVQSADLQRGSKFTDKSSLYHLDGQYNFSQIRSVDLLVGANGRYFVPNSFGTIFSDTLLNPNDTLADGSANPEGAYNRLSLWEVGGFVQASKRFFDDKLRIIGSVRVDKNQNFEPQFSPRLSASWNLKNHNIRVGVQSAFRTPTLQNQFINLDLGPITLIGNLNGITNVYTLNSLTAFNQSLAAVNGDLNAVDVNILVNKEYQALKPEQVKTLEIGYRGVVKNKIYLDADAYFNQYTNFIADVRLVAPTGSAVAGEQSGLDAVVTKLYEVYQVPVNSTKTVYSVGGGVGIGYSISNKYQLQINYTYAQLLTEGLEEDLIPGFNTTPHKVNVGFSGKQVFKNLGFSTNFQYVHGFEWQSTFGTGNIPAYTVLDVQLSYPFTVNNNDLVIRIGSSNVLNQQRREIFGGPMIGRMIYTTLGFNLDRKKS
ncbi:MAG: TonB-dependent receptor plug domain-containing protein [Bacteroidetes bacterium]|nr:TonB-dependent receptor plug domain-containing protein [Bacteroidota bacterium]MBM3424640.1 TonB-dependent receptor [Bacteroidota bacterium]